MSITAAELLVKVGADTAAAEKELQSFSQRMTGIGKNLAVTGGLLTAGVTAPLMLVGKQAIDAAADFEQTMNIMQQVTGATSANMAQMEQQALQLGASTVFSAGEAAQGMLELGKAGMNATQVMAAMPGVLDLAAAGGVAVGEAASVTISALNAFNLEASESARVADLMAAAANASAADISDLAMGFQQGAFAFSAAGQDIDDLAASLAILTNVGLTGSDAGTALKNAFVRMMSPTKEAKGLMKELGISFFDANGQMKDLPDIIDILNTSMAGMTDQQRLAALETLFMSDGMKAFIPLLDQGKEGFLEMMEAVNQQGAATDVANARMGGLKGAIEEFQGTIETLMLGAMKPYLDMMGDMIRGVANLMEGFFALSPNVRNAALAFLAVLAAAGPVILAIGGIATALGFLATPIGLVVAGVAALAAAFAGDLMGIRTKTMAVFKGVSNLWGALKQAGPNSMRFRVALLTLPKPLREVASFSLRTVDGLQEMWSAFRDAGLNSSEFQKAMSLLPAPLQTAAQAMLTGWNTISGAVQTAWESIRGHLASLNGWLAVTIPVALAALGAWWETTWSGITTFFEPIIARLQEAFGGVGQQFAALGPSVQGLWQSMQPVLAGIAQGFAAIAGLIGAGLVVAVTLAMNFVSALLNNLAGLLQPLIDQFSLAFGTISTVFGAAVAAVQAIIAGDWAAAWESAKTAVGALKDFISGTFTNLTAFVSAMFSVLAETVINTLSDLGFEGAAEQVRGFIATLAGLAGWLAVAIPGALAAMGAAWNGVWSAVAGFFEPIVARLGAAVGGIGGQFAALGPAMQEMWGVVQPVIALIQEGFAAMVAVVQAMWQQVQPIFAAIGYALAAIAGAIGAGLVVAVGLAMNAVSALINNLAALLEPLINQFTALFDFIVTTFAAAVVGLTAIMNGDWAGAWEAGKAAVTGLTTFVQQTLGNFIGMFAAITSVILETFSTTLSDLGFEGAAEKVEAFRAKLNEVWDWLQKFVTGEIKLEVKPLEWITNLLAWAWPDADWSWVTTLTDWDWPDFDFSWVASLTAWKWPDFDFSWVSKLTSWKWPTLSMPDWVARLFSFGGGGASAPAPAPSGGGYGAGSGGIPGYDKVTGHARGTNFHPGGLAIVGEEGPELLNLPRGSQVMPNGETMRLLAMLANIPGYADGVGMSKAGGPGAGFALPGAKGSNAMSGLAKGVARATTDEMRRQGATMTRQVAQEAKVAMTRAADDTAAAFGKTADWLKSALQKVPGLFSPSSVTAEDMRDAELGIYKPKADEYLRQARDEIKNGVDWANVDVADMASAIGMDPNLPAEIILKLFEEAWANQSLWANPANIEKFINKDAVQAQLAEQMAQEAGKSNLLAFFGIDEEKAQSEVAGLAGNVAQGVAKGLTPEALAPAGQSLLNGIAQSVSQPTQAESIALSEGISSAIASGLGQGVDQGAADSFFSAIQKAFATESSVAKLMDIGEQMAKNIYNGWKRWAAEADWPSAIPPGAGATPPATTPAPPVGANATGSMSWRGGWSWVGERGKELVRLPAASRIWPHEQSMALAGATSGPAVVVNATVNNDLDAEGLGWTVARHVQRKRRRF